MKRNVSIKYSTFLTLGLTAAFCAGLAMTSFAGEWKQDERGHWWQNDDGTYPAGCWQWIDGNGDGTAESYYFGADGYLLVNTTTPDGYQVNEQGAWTVDGAVQTQAVSGSEETGAGAAEEPQTAKWNKAFVKEEYVSFMGRDISHVFEALGEERNPYPLFGMIGYIYSFDDGCVVEFFTNDDGIVIEIRSFHGAAFLNAERRTYTYDELNSLFGINYDNETHDDVSLKVEWKLDDHVSCVYEAVGSYEEWKLLYSN